MSPRRSKSSVEPSGERSTDIHVPSLTVKLTFRASGLGLLMSSAGSNFFFAVWAFTESVRSKAAIAIFLKRAPPKATLGGTLSATSDEIRRIRPNVSRSGSSHRLGETRMSKLGRTLLILVIMAVATAGLYAWTRNGKKDENGLKEVEITTGTIVEKAVAVGQIQPRQKFQVKSKISGIVRRTLVEVGDTVKPGDPLFEIGPDPTPLEVTEVERRVESAEASFRRAEGDYKRAQELSRSGVLPNSDVEQKKEAYELARVALMKAQQDRELTRRGNLSSTVAKESIIRS